MIRNGDMGKGVGYLEFSRFRPTDIRFVVWKPLCFAELGEYEGRSSEGEDPIRDMLNRFSRLNRLTKLRIGLGSR